MDVIKLNALSLDVIQGKKGALRRYLEILQRSFKIQGDTGVIKPHSDQIGFVLARTGTFLQKPGSKILIPS